MVKMFLIRYHYFISLSSINKNPKTNYVSPCLPSFKGICSSLEKISSFIHTRVYLFLTQIILGVTRKYP
jgi:hypothetical protein